MQRLLVAGLPRLPHGGTAGLGAAVAHAPRAACNTR